MHPERLAGLVLIDVSPEAAGSSGAERIVDFTRGTPTEFDSIDELVERAVAFNPKRRKPLLQRSLFHNLRRLPNGKLGWKYDRRMLTGNTQGIAAALRELGERAHAVSCATLVVRGGESDVVTRAGAEAFAARFPAGRFVEIPGAGHSVQGDAPAALVAQLRQFLECRTG
jgi:pimeloyl-ACP methyl ester carboxylesterase